MTIDLPAMIRVRLAGRNNSGALVYGGVWRNWDWLGRAAGALNAAIGEVSAAGLVARNRPHAIAAFAANLAHARATVMIHSAQTPAGLAADIRRLRLPVIVADQQDWTEETLAAARETGGAAIATDERGAEPSIRTLVPGEPGPFRPIAADTALELLSSGTTGAPKRVSLSWDTIANAVDSAATAYAGSGSGETPQIMVHPLGNVAGLGYAAPSLAFGRPLVLLEKFEARAWAEAVRDYRPARGTVPPAGVQMLLDSDVPRDWLASLGLVAVGGGRLDPALQIAFEERFGVPILTAFGATEFGGVIANWSLDLYREWGAAKRGSAGLASAGVSLRVVDRESHTELPPGVIGLMEAKVSRIGPGWIRTNDLASIDADGFLFIHGRADGAINRGGFKIVPEEIAGVLAGYPGVAEAAVVGISDARLGEVPVAMVEARPGTTIDPAALKAWARDRLAAYQVPVEIRAVEALPRNASMKVALHEVKALFARP